MLKRELRQYILESRPVGKKLTISDKAKLPVVGGDKRSVSVSGMSPTFASQRAKKTANSKGHYSFNKYLGGF